ncbi:hypothetical protein [Arcanobacterium pinnipediorum]|uniref:Uncharacterized protein n=1 Tax=Arcanobacterium pinnipediorum TaxID=1503041 RepID=A0ABY5AJW7_9ACTO|nr:hypothetical protein [Arcanobacterium pinnipediorum]USR80157.1 hypothetical protein NG665_04085 [Arcanobacterium pinnipediorum]
MMPLSFWLACGVVIFIIGAAGIVLSTKARRLDALHKNILRSRASFENALTTRARIAQEVAQSGVLDLAGSVVLNNAAHDAGDAAGYILVDDGLDEIKVHRSAPTDVAVLKRGGPDRLDLESELSRVLRLTVDQLEEIDREGYTDILERLHLARHKVRLTRRFHNIHVAGARRIRQSWLARLFHIQGYAAWPQTIDIDDE